MEKFVFSSWSLPIHVSFVALVRRVVYILGSSLHSGSPQSAPSPALQNASRQGVEARPRHRPSVSSRIQMGWFINQESTLATYPLQDLQVKHHRPAAPKSPAAPLLNGHENRCHQARGSTSPEPQEEPNCSEAPTWRATRSWLVTAERMVSIY